MKKTYNLNKRENIYYLSKEDIEFETEYILREYFNECLERPQPIPIEKVIEKMGLSIEFAKLSENNDIYGAFVFNKGIINIYENDKQIGRYFEKKTIIIDSDIYEKQAGITFFTLGHELGHYFLQYRLKHIDEDQVSILDLLNKEEKAKYYIDSNKVLQATLNSDENIYKFSFVEWQANYFSACILVPKKALDMKLKEIYPQFRKTQFYSTLNNLNDLQLANIIVELKNTFGVSKEMMKNRLHSLGYIQNNK